MGFPDTGALHAHPTIQGILLAALEEHKQTEHGVPSMKGLKLSDLGDFSNVGFEARLDRSCCSPRRLERRARRWTLSESFSDKECEG